MFPKTLKELQDLIIRIWKPSIDSLRRTKQDNIQFQDEGVDQGTSGGITTVNFTGPGLTASDSGSTLTVNITGGGGGVSSGGGTIDGGDRLLGNALFDGGART